MEQKSSAMKEFRSREADTASWGNRVCSERSVLGAGVW